MLDLTNKDFLKKIKSISELIKLTEEVCSLTGIYDRFPDLMELANVEECIGKLNYTNDKEKTRDEVLSIYNFISDKSEDERTAEFVPEFEIILDVFNDKIREKGYHYG